MLRLTVAPLAAPPVKAIQIIPPDADVPTGPPVPLTPATFGRNAGPKSTITCPLIGIGTTATNMMLPDPTLPTMFGESDAASP